MIKVLQVYPQLNNAGTEMVIMNLYKNIDRSIVQFDFLVEESGELDETVRALGGRIYYIKEKNKNQYSRKLIEFFSLHNDYNIVQTHTHARMGLVLKAANVSGVKCRIAHSHNSRADLPEIFRFYKAVKNKIIEENATDFFSCSLEAAKWMFPHKYKHTKVIPNAIDLEKFTFNEKKRVEIRRKYGISDHEKVVCHVGRFAKEKNHGFIVDVANDFIKKDNFMKLILVGVGPLDRKIREKVHKYGINGKVLFLGNRTDVQDIMSASDIFILPSLHEGLGIVLVEAQANGLFCLASSGVPKEADIGKDLFYRKALSEGSYDWAEYILKKLGNDEIKERKGKLKSLSPSKYDIKETSLYLQKFYQEVGRRS